jgi:UDP-N-acetylglucosamine 2-epimerase (non-hydrolysing)
VAFYQKIKIGHVEAGLRTYNKFSPFPEEINRQLLSKITDLHFAPTKSARKNLLREGFNKKSIILTGNTIVDAMEWGIKKINDYNFLKKSEEINNLEKIVDIKKKIILVTMHRRESFGEDIKNVCEALKFISNKYNDVEIIYPVHLNPNVIEPVNKILSGEKNIKLIKPLSYEAFLWLMNKSYLIITDSGGIQEEVPSFKKPVLVIRDFTERNESVKLGLSKLVGTKTQNIINNISLLLESKKDYEKMIADKNPYGDGNASKRIVLAILNYFKENNQEYD